MIVSNVTKRLRCPTDRTPSVSRRAGLSLLEVILSLAIFVGSIAIISKLIDIGTRAAQYNQLQTRAILLAESKMNEIVAGLVPLSSATGSQTFEQDVAWQWNVVTSDGNVPGLLLVQIEVTPNPNGELASVRENIRYRLARWVLDPEFTLTLQEEALEAEEAEAEQ